MPPSLGGTVEFFDAQGVNETFVDPDDFTPGRDWAVVRLDEFTWLYFNAFGNLVCKVTKNA